MNLKYLSGGNMNKKKRNLLILIFISIFLVLSFSGCGNDKKAPVSSIVKEPIIEKSVKTDTDNPAVKSNDKADVEHKAALQEKLTAVRGTENDTPGKVVLSVVLGAENSQLPGKAEDVDNLTDGFPPAYDIDEKGNIHILDSVNKRIVVYKKDINSDKMIFDISISLTEIPGLDKKSRVLQDLSGPTAGSYAILDKSAGMVFVIDLKGEVKWYVGGQKFAKHIYLHHDGRLFVTTAVPGEPEKVVVFDSKEKPLAVFTGTFIKPWLSIDNKLFSINNHQSPAVLESVDIVSKLKKEFAQIKPLDGMAYAGSDIMAVTSGGFPVIAVLSAKAVNQNTPDQRETYKKSIVSYNSTGKQLTSMSMSQPNMELKNTPRLHRVGKDDMLYTLRIENNIYKIYKKEL